MPAKTLIALLCLLCIGCGVRMEIVTPVQPTPTPRSFPNIDYSLGGVWRLQAAPQVVFSANNAYDANLFLQHDQPDAYLLLYRWMGLGVEYDVTWFAPTTNSTQIRLTVFTRPNDLAPWERWDTTERLLTTAETPTNQRDTLSLTLYFEERVTLEVRAEVSLSVYLPGGEIVNRVEINEFTLTTLTPPEMEFEPEDLRPPFEDANADLLLLDWRDFQDGPCGLRIEFEVFQAACDQLEANDIPAVITEFEALIASQPDHRAAIYGQLGFFQLFSGDLTASEQAFERAAQTYLQDDQVWEATVHLHNWLSVALMNGSARADEALFYLTEFREQFYDEPGIQLTQANLGLVYEESWRIETSRDYLDDYDLPQVETLNLWIERLDE